MKISNFCIQHPIFAFVINSLMMLVGLYALTGLQVRQFPTLVIPSVTVTTLFPGAGPEIVETQVTAVLEQAIGAISGIETLSSTTTQGQSLISINFAVGTDPFQASDDVRAKVAEVRGKMPTDALAPIVTATDVNSLAVLYLSFTDKTRSEMEVTELVQRAIVPQLATVPGVAQSQLVGDRKYAIQVELDPIRMAALGVTVHDVFAALSSQAADIPGGEIRRSNSRISVTVAAGLNRPQQFEDLVLRSSGTSGYIVRIGDVGRATVGPDLAAVTTAVSYSGQSAIAVGVVPQLGANPLAIAKAVKDKLPELRAALPAGLEVDVGFDTSIYIQSSITEVVETVFIAVLLVIGVVIVFLGSLRSSLIALVTIPLSLTGTLAFIYLVGFSINLFSLLAMILAIGLVVDDAIVEIENVQRHVDAGMSPTDASFKGSDEIGFAVIATTLTLASVFIPVGLMPGVAGQMFREFSFSLAAAVLISGFIARTLSPPMCALMIRPSSHNILARAVDASMAWLSEGYRRILLQALAHRWLVGLLAVAAIGVAVEAARHLQTEVAPPEDQGYIILQLTGPQNASLDYLTRWARQAEAIYREQPEVVSSFSMIGMPTPHQIMSMIILKPWDQRQRNAETITAAMMPSLQNLPGVQIAVFATNPLSAGAGGQAVQLILRTTGEFTTLAETADVILREAAKRPELVNLSSDLSIDTPRLMLHVDRNLSATMGLSIADIGTDLQAMLSGRNATTFAYNGNLYNVTVGLRAEQRGNFRVIDEIYTRSKDGKLVPIGAVVSVSQEAGPSTLTRYNQQRSAKLGADLRPGYTAPEGLAALTAVAKQLLPPGVSIAFDATAQQAQQAGEQTGILFLFALIFVYMMLAAQFNSLRDPAIILLLVPFAIAGAIVALWLRGDSINLYSGVGFVTLIGLIAKHGILITEFANQLRDEGMDRHDAIVHAAVLRLRPIIMTTAATVLGALPLAVATGAGAASLQSIGMVIVGGVLFGTFVSLFMIPVAYTILSARKRPVIPPVPDFHHDPRAGGQQVGASLAGSNDRREVPQ